MLCRSFYVLFDCLLKLQSQIFYQHTPRGTFTNTNKLRMLLFKLASDSRARVLCACLAEFIIVNWSSHNVMSETDSKQKSFVAALHDFQRDDFFFSFTLKMYQYLLSDFKNC